MSKKLSLILAVALLTNGMVGISVANAAPDSKKLSGRAQKVRSGIFKLGAGPDAHVAVTLRDKTRLAGYVSEASDDSFVITDFGTGAATTVAYTNVNQVQGHNVATGVKVAVVAGIIVGAVFLFLLFLRSLE